MQISNNNQLQIFLFILIFVLASVLLITGHELFAVLVLLSYALLVFHRSLTSWTSLIIALTVLVLVVPAKLYKLPSILPFDVEIYRIVTFLLLCAWIVALLIDPRIKASASPVNASINIFATSITISFFVNIFSFEVREEFTQALKALFYPATLVLLFYMIVSVFKSTEAIDKVLRVIVGTTSVIAVLGIIERVTTYNAFRHLHIFIPLLRLSNERINEFLSRGGGIRIYGSTAHPIAFGTLLALVLPIAVYYWLNSTDERHRVANLLGVSVIITAMLLTVSRTAMIGLAVALVVLALKKPEWKTKILAVTILMFFCIHMMFPGILGTFRSTMTPSNVIKSEVGNRGGRLEDYPRMLREFKNNPLFGRGYGTFDPIKFFFVDNQYLKFLVELGLFGILAFVLLLYKAISMLLRKEKTRGSPDYSPLSAIAASIMVFGIVSATFDTFGFPQVTYLFFILLSLGTAYALNLETEDASMQGELIFNAS